MTVVVVIYTFDNLCWPITLKVYETAIIELKEDK